MPSAILAQGNPFQGVYEGRLLVKLAGLSDPPEFYPSRMTVLPDGHSIILTTQVRNHVSTTVIRGSFSGNLVEDASTMSLMRGRRAVKSGFSRTKRELRL